MEAPRSPTKARGGSRSRKSIAHIPPLGMIRNEENMTADVNKISTSASPTKAGGKKGRSKSIGPGGLDALQDDSGNRQKFAMAVQYKSILKPTIPLSSPKPIPPHNKARKTSPSKSNQKSSPGKSRIGRLVDSAETGDSLLLPQWKESAKLLSERIGQPRSPSHGHTRVAVRTEEQQRTATEERERQETMTRRDARRKSLANRRVSFAPEATLHTWDVVEMPEDSTTSSASTNTTRRASSLTSSAMSPYPQPRSLVEKSETSEPPSTPPQQAAEVQVAASPAHQRDLHQKKRRRSSEIPPMNFNNPDDFSSSPRSACSGDSDDADLIPIADEIDAASSGSDDSDLMEDETVTGIDGEDHTRRSDESSASASSSRLEKALRQAAQEAGTQGIDYDENGDITMEMADDKATAAFKPWTERGNKGLQILGDSSAQNDQENINPFSPAFKATTQQHVEEDKEETMEFTKAMGSILPPGQQERDASYPSASYPETYAQSRITGGCCRLSATNSDVGDETMELTMAVGGIEQNFNTALVDEGASNLGTSGEDEGLSMDFTAVVGGLLGREPRVSDQKPSLTEQYGNQLRGNECTHQDDVFTVEDGAQVDLTSTGDRILSSVTECMKPTKDVGIGIENPGAHGATFLEERITGVRHQTRGFVQQEMDAGILKRTIGRTAKELLPDLVAPNVQEAEDSSLALERDGTKTPAHDNYMSVTPERLYRQQTCIARKPSTPSKQLTPKVVRPTTPGKTPPPKNVAMRAGSPKKLFKAEMKQANPSPDRGTANLFVPLEAKLSNSLTSSIDIKPGSRRLSGVGLDRMGMGSPRVTEILKRRDSLTNSSADFVPDRKPSGGVRFADPRALEQEVERERLDEQRHESRRGVQSEPNFQAYSSNGGTILNLKDQIQRLTPQKKRLNGRKSLHVGAARGILGKRPVELDEEEEDATSLKHLNIMEGSPVKKVKLPAPPSKDTTSGRVTRSARHSLGETSLNVPPNKPCESVSPLKAGFATTPNNQPHSTAVRTVVSTSKGLLDIGEESAASVLAFGRLSGTDEPIHLQDFLNLTSIRFIELTTTKRRHTVAPNPLLLDGSAPVDAEEADNTQGHYSSGLERCIVAGACTLPMLDLYQHSCRELKKYIAEGRNIVREIEAETFEDNPNLFGEYMSAPADVRSLMDNQFKNVKTHARLLSKAMWYEWRMKLLEGLKEGLLKNSEGMNEDVKNLAQQERLIHTVLPDMTVEHDRLERDIHTLQARADELASCDQRKLKDVRSNLVAIEDDISAKRKLVDGMRSRLKQTEISIEDAVETKHECAAEIQKAEKVRQECRGWDPADIRALEGMSLKYSVNAFEQDQGWAIAAAADETLAMTYNRVLQLYFTPRAFNSKPKNQNFAGSGNASISLTYIADGHEHHPQPLSTEKRFFLQIMRAQLQFLEQSSVRVKDLLSFISTSWREACHVAEEARILGVLYMTQPTIMSDETLAIKCSVLLREMKTRVEVVFDVSINSGESVAGMDVLVKPSARVVYGEELNGEKMCGFLEQKLGGRNKGGDCETGRWCQIVRELEERLTVRGKRL